MYVNGGPRLWVVCLVTCYITSPLVSLLKRTSSIVGPPRGSKFVVLTCFNVEKTIQQTSFRSAYSIHPDSRVLVATWLIGSADASDICLAFDILCT
ncbi:hypothetical protein C8R46DRAFT_312412 [Mycena filopes]|nr:hypothetical protein C8R46DRAFT_312412 [Mycena filopes]